MGVAGIVDSRDTIIDNVRIPRSLLRDPLAFGGRPEGDCIAGNLVVRNGRVAGMLNEGRSESDLKGRIITQAFVEAHCHLDKCFTAGRLDHAGGNLEQAIAAQAKDKAQWTREDVMRRASRGLEELARSGTRLVRTHVDWDVDHAHPDRVPLAWAVLSELADSWRDRLILQRSALVPIDVMASGSYADGLAATVARSKGVLGAFVFRQASRRDGIRNMIRAADKHGLALDFHVDEGLDPALDGLEIIASELLAARHEGPVLCGHACSLATIDADTRARRIGLVAKAGLSIACLPTSNLYLQDQGQDVPPRRGLTAVRALVAGGVNTVFGTDNVQDAFCPVGVHSPASALQTAVLAAQLKPPIGDWLPSVMGNAARALGVEMLALDDGAAVEDLLVWDAEDSGDLIGATANPTTGSAFSGLSPASISHEKTVALRTTSGS